MILARRRVVGALLAALAVLFAPSIARGGDPYLRWYTIETPHFRVSYHSGLEAPAQRLANLSESIYARLTPALGYAPSARTELLLTDDTDSANGSATAIPYNAVRLFATAPDDMSPLGDYDDWLGELVTHEFTHILHADNISGLPAVVNAILGKTYAPNQAQPRWVLEGLAVAMETAHTGGGRLRSSLWDMYLRADVLEGNLARLDQFSNSARRWPGGNLWYLYGSEFIAWIEDVYGPDTYSAVATDYGANLIAWGINRSIRRVTGRTYVELYEGFRQELARRYEAQAREVRRRGLREGTQLTHRGRIASSPRFAPACARTGAREELFYLRDDGDTPGGIYRLPLDARDRADEASAELVSRSVGSVITFDGCSLVFDSVAPSRRLYYFGDLFRQPSGTIAPRGLDRSRERLTTGRRAAAPDVSRDGRRIVYTTNRAGTTTLRIAELTPEHRIVGERALVPSARHEQAYTPRFSPDGRQVAYSAWTAGGYRDIRIVEVATGRYYELAHDRAIDQQPTFSPDGRTVYFSSDRTGIANVYGFDLESRELRQITNVLNGAYMPEISPDGRTLTYVGYTHRGFDLFSLPLEPARFLAAEPYLDRRPALDATHSHRRWPVRDYSPLQTLRPRAWDYLYGPGTFGPALTVTTRGSDLAGLHAFSASITVEAEQGEPSASLAYSYRRLPFDLDLSVFRSTAPVTSYFVNEERPLVTEHYTGLSSGISYPIPGEFDSQAVSLGYTIAKHDATLPVGPGLDPFAALPREPDRTWVGVVHLGYGYSNASGTANGISAERGFSVAVGTDIGAHELGSESTLTALSARVVGYVPLPWANHHVLSLAASGAVSDGTYARRGRYYTGGFVDTPPFDAYTTTIRQRSFVLRGYAPVAFTGTQYSLLNAEYRFPLLYADRGVSTLPVFLRTVSAAAFADYGGAFDTLDLDDPLASYHLGVGGELWFDLILGYFAGANLRLGYAHGVDDPKAIPGGKFYFIAASPF
ncbi:MAG: BamA/TamA family outer membrane protein [Sorangiineae bacterium]|nr:BamA/TamA family outer membrane protein [Polyangiaceae bacterium]MEB2322719.1 BamA/TamA family outer membrane protein [Sorangiineae bacterium]